VDAPVQINSLDFVAIIFILQYMQPLKNIKQLMQTKL